MAALSGVVDSGRLRQGIEGLRRLGFEPVLAPNLELREGLFAGSDRERIAGFYRLLQDDAISAVFFARGGHGALRVLGDLDWELVGRQPRWFVGYSDVTPFLLELSDRFDWVSLHGPMVAVELAAGLEPGESRALLRALAGEAWEPIPLAGVRGEWPARPARLLGGCLSMLAATLGTPHAFLGRGSVLFLEDVDEPLYRMDRMLQQLRLAGALEGVEGVVLGSMGLPASEAAEVETVLEAVSEATGGAPVAWGCPAGHCRPNLVLPVGGLVTVDASSRCLRVAGPEGSDA